MAISPPSDIILDVAKAVEPAGVQAARAALVNRTGNVAGAFSLGEEAPLTSRTGGLSRQPDQAAPDASMKRFEAMVLQTFIENMLPKNTESVYGKGMAGDMWKSMMAEHLAGATAEAGGIGIAKSLTREHYIKDEKVVPVGVVSGGPDQAALDQQTSQATALLQEMQRKMVQSLGSGNAGSATDNKS
ncbi:rod-binding protein [Mesorhizobium sp. ANAO-SY3R2]|uniref:rod-binding protein n=1 Tax=Mesorhizobium sp. ANAO-SY3R2 TaxID=3166644 RepID=UPI0036733C88